MNITIDNLDNWLKIGVSIVSSIIFFYKLFQRLLRKELAPFNDRMDKIDEDRKKQHEETLIKIAEVKKDNDYGNIDNIRSRICAFDMLCRTDVNNDIIQLHQYNSIFLDINKWKEYHKLYPELNGVINVAIENINEHYKNAKFK